MIPPSSLAFPLLEGHPCWSTCGRRTRLQMIPPSSLVISQGWGCLIFHCARPTRAFSGRALREHRRSSGSIPSSVPGAQDQRGCPSHPFHRARSASKKDGLAISAYPFQARSPISPQSSLVDPQMRASRGILLCSKHLLQGAVEVALNCAHRATTALSWGLCEHEGHLTAPDLPF